MAEESPLMAVRVLASGPAPQVEVDDVVVAPPGPGQVRVTTRAAGLCFADVLMSLKMYPGTPAAPFTLGYDVTGVVEAVGPGVTQVAPGELVTGLTVRGGLASQCLVETSRLVTVPAGVDAAQVAALPLNYVSAYQMLTREAAVKHGETILVHGAAGGVGSAFLDLAGALGVRVIGVARAERLDEVRAEGAEAVDRGGDVVAQVLALTDGRGVDAAFDPVGGPTVLLSRRCLTGTGRLVTFGYSHAALTSGSIAATFLRQQARILWWGMTDRGRRFSDYSITRRAAAHPEDYVSDLTTLLGRLAAGEIAPVVVPRAGLEWVPEGLRTVRTGRAVGKLVAVLE